MNELAEKQSTEISDDVIDLSQYQGLGTEEATVDDMSIPFLSIIQKMNPQCDVDDPKYDERFKPGMIYNTVTQELFEGRENGLICHHVAFKKNWVEWVPRNQGGGMRGLHENDADILRTAKKHPERPFILVTEAGTELIDTRYHYVIYLDPNDVNTWYPAVISMTSTQVKYSRKWVSRLNTTTMKLGDNVIKPPSWTFPYRLSAMPDENTKGSFLSWKIIKIEEAISNRTLFQDCVKFYKAVAAGETKLADMDQDTQSGEMESEDIPF